MSKKYWPLKCAEVKKILANLGLVPRPQKGTSHEHWVGHIRGKFRKVTVDCPKAPFSNDLVAFMYKQAGVTKKEFYGALVKENATKIIDETQQQEG